MPITKAAKKALRVSRRRLKINLKVKKNLAIAIAKFKKKPTAGKLAICFSFIDKAVKKNIIHKHKAARWRSRLANYLTKSQKSQTAKTRLQTKKK